MSLDRRPGRSTEVVGVPSSVEGGPPDGGRRPARWRMTARDVRDALLGVLPTAVALLLASWVLPGLHLTAWAAVVAAVVVSVADALVRPLLRWIAGRLGAVVALLLGLAVQLVVVQAALTAAPGTYADTIGTAAATLVLVAILGAVGRWMLGAADREYLVADLIRRAERRRRRAGPAGGSADAPGVVLVQIDGLPHAVMTQGILSGNLPTLSRWARSGTHHAAAWGGRAARRGGAGRPPAPPPPGGGRRAARAARRAPGLPAGRRGGGGVGGGWW